MNYKNETNYHFTNTIIHITNRWQVDYKTPRVIYSSLGSLQGDKDISTSDFGTIP